MPSIWITSNPRSERSDPIHSSSRAADSATKRREAADFHRPEPLGAGTSPSGKRIERSNLRVETLISIWFMAHLPSQSSVIAPFQLGRASSLPSKLRSRGRAISTLPPWKPILPFVLPQRCAVRSLPRPWRGPHAVCASTSIISPSASSPAARQSLSTLADMLASASIFNSLAGIAVDVISLFMALLSSRGISTPSLQARGEQRRFFYFNNDRDILAPSADAITDRQLIKAEPAIGIANELGKAGPMSPMRVGNAPVRPEAADIGAVRRAADVPIRDRPFGRRVCFRGRGRYEC